MRKKKNIWDSLSFVMRAKNRKIVLKSLVTPQTPSSIRERTKLNIKVVSRALKELSREGLITCKTPNLKLGKIYVLTKKGREILKMIKE